MQNTSLCYLEHDGKVLLIHRTKRKQDINAGKWIGIGGHFLENESPEECMLRELKEETGLTPARWRYRAVITFVSEGAEGEYMHLFTASDPQGTLTDCDEGFLEWVDKDRIFSLPTWEGDLLFLKELEKNRPFFLMKLCYRKDRLVSASLDGHPLELPVKENG